jgi:SAM-dependent methyltransferase
MDFLTPQEIAQMLLVPGFKDSRDAQYRLDLAYLSYAMSFVGLLSEYHFDSHPKIIADIGTGYGWLAAVAARRTDAKIIAVEPSESRMAAAQRLVEILGVEQRIIWRTGGLPELPLADQEADVTFCVEVIEHVGISRSIVAELGRVTKDMLIITTPNRLFPCIRHDTSLPFCHWLPPSIRDVYAGLFGRRHLQDNNLFWSPGLLLGSLPEFERVSKMLQFKDVSAFLKVEKALEATFGKDYATPGRVCRRLFFSGLGRVLGPLSLYALPNLASTFRRKSAGSPSAPRDTG